MDYYGNWSYSPYNTGNYGYTGYEGYGGVAGNYGYNYDDPDGWWFRRRNFFPFSPFFFI